jgi:hypothetical protein
LYIVHIRCTHVGDGTAHVDEHLLHGTHDRLNSQADLFHQICDVKCHEWGDTIEAGHEL